MQNIRKKITLLLILAFGLFALFACSNKEREFVIVPSSKSFSSSHFTNYRQVFVKEVRDDVLGLYTEIWNEETNAINSTLYSSEVFTVKDENFVELGITDFNVVDVFTDKNGNNYDVFIEANEKVYQVSLSYTNGGLWILPRVFHIDEKIKEVDYAKDGFGKYLYANTDGRPYENRFMDLSVEPIIENVENKNIYAFSPEYVGTYGDDFTKHEWWYFHRNNDGVLTCERRYYTNEVPTYDEEGYRVNNILSEKITLNLANIDIKSSRFLLRDGTVYLIIITNDNRIIQVNTTTSQNKIIDVPEVNYWTFTYDHNYFALITNNQVLLYDYDLDLLNEYKFDFNVNSFGGVILESKFKSEEGKLGSYEYLYFDSAYLKGDTLVRYNQTHRLISK